VVKTSGGINTLEIYQRLGVKEVWFWKNNKLTVYCLRGDKYQISPQSELLSDLDLQVLIDCAMELDALKGMKTFREKIKG